jgi:hypothetical protein
MKSLPIARRIKAVDEIALDTQPLGYTAGDVDDADVCGNDGLNARPAVMLGEFLSEAPVEVPGLADVIGRHFPSPAIWQQM